MSLSLFGGELQRLPYIQSYTQGLGDSGQGRGAGRRPQQAGRNAPPRGWVRVSAESWALGLGWAAKGRWLGNRGRMGDPVRHAGKNLPANGA